MKGRETWVDKVCTYVEIAGVCGVLFGVVAILISIAKWIWCL